MIQDLSGLWSRSQRSKRNLWLFSGLDHWALRHVFITNVMTCDSYAWVNCQPITIFFQFFFTLVLKEDFAMASCWRILSCIWYCVDDCIVFQLILYAKRLCWELWLNMQSLRYINWCHLIYLHLVCSLEKGASLVSLTSSTWGKSLHMLNVLHVLTLTKVWIRFYICIRNSRSKLRVRHIVRLKCW